MLFGESNLAFIPVQRQCAQPQGVGGTVPLCYGNSFPKQWRQNNDQALGRIVKNSFRWAGSSPPVQVTSLKLCLKEHKKHRLSWNSFCIISESFSEILSIFIFHHAFAFHFLCCWDRWITLPLSIISLFSCSSCSSALQIKWGIYFIFSIQSRKCCSTFL